MTRKRRTLIQRRAPLRSSATLDHVEPPVGPPTEDAPTEEAATAEPSEVPPGPASSPAVPESGPREAVLVPLAEGSDVASPEPETPAMPTFVSASERPTVIEEPPEDASAMDAPPVPALATTHIAARSEAPEEVPRGEGARPVGASPDPTEAPVRGPVYTAFPSMPPAIFAPSLGGGLGGVTTASDDPPPIERPSPSAEPEAEVPLTMARAVHGAHHDAAYTVPQVPETLRRFDAVLGSDSFAGRVETSIQMPAPPGEEPRSDSSLPDLRFDPSVAPSTPGTPWLALGLLVLFGLGVVAVVFTTIDSEPAPPSVPAAVAPIVEEAPTDDAQGGLEPGESVVEAIEPVPAANKDRAPAPRAPVAPSPPEANAAVPVVPEPTPPTVAAPPPEPPVAEPPTFGSLRIRSNKKALVYVDNQPVGFTPKTLEVTTGVHTVSVVQPGQSDTRQTKTVEVRQGKTEGLRFTF